MERLIDDRETDFLLGFLDEDAPAVGVVQLRHRFGVWRAGGDCLVEDVFVAEEARGSGLGRALMTAAVERARERGARRMELDVNERNEAALALYGSFGFCSAETPGRRPRSLHAGSPRRGSGRLTAYACAPTVPESFPHVRTRQG